MLRQIFTSDVATIKRHIQNHKQGNGPMVVAIIAGWSGTPQFYDVREELHPVTPRPEKPVLGQYQCPPLLPSSPKRLEVQIHPHGSQPWHIAQTLYLKIEEEGVC